MPDLLVFEVITLEILRGEADRRHTLHSEDRSICATHLGRFLTGLSYLHLKRIIRTDQFDRGRDLHEIIIHRLRHRDTYRRLRTTVAVEHVGDLRQFILVSLHPSLCAEQTKLLAGETDEDDGTFGFRT